MANIKVATAGLNDVLGSLDGVGVSIDAVGSDVLRKAAAPVLAAMEQNALPHRRTGRLQAALKIGKSKRTRYRRSVDVGVFGNDAPHAHLVEFGHGGPAPAPEHPFMAPAYEATKDEAMRIVRDAIAEALGL